MATVIEWQVLYTQRQYQEAVEAAYKLGVSRRQAHRDLREIAFPCRFLLSREGTRIR